MMPEPSSAPKQEAQASRQASGQAPSGEEAQASVPSEPPAIALPDLPMVGAEERMRRNEGKFKLAQWFRS